MRPPGCPGCSLQRGSGQGCALRGVVTQQRRRASPGAARRRRALPLLADGCTVQHRPSLPAVLRCRSVLRGSPGAAARPCGPLTGCAGRRPAAGRQRDPVRGRAGQSAGRQAPVRAHAAEGAHARRALPVHPAADGVGACGGAGACQAEQLHTGGLQTWRSAVHPCRPPACAAALTRRGCTHRCVDAYSLPHSCAPGSLAAASLRSRSRCLCAWRARACAAVLAAAESGSRRGLAMTTCKLRRVQCVSCLAVQACSLSLGVVGI